jgi:hypothetical protein
VAGRPRARARRAANGGVAYTSELAEAITELVADGHSLGAVAAMGGFPTRRSIRRWLAEHPDFRAMYETARIERAEALFEDLERLASTGPQVVAAAQAAGINENAAVTAWKAELAARQWALSKIAPARYADKLAVEASGPGGMPFVQEVSIERTATMLMAVLEAGRPSRTIDQEVSHAKLPAPDPDVERKRRQAQMDGTLPRPSLGAVDEPLPLFEPQPAPRRPPPEDLANWRDKAEAERVHQRIARISRSYP